MCRKSVWGVQKETQASDARVVNGALPMKPRPEYTKDPLEQSIPYRALSGILDGDPSFGKLRVS